VFLTDRPSPDLTYLLPLHGPYGGHSADLLFHIIISELQYIILDSSPKKISWREIYLLGVFIYWACLFIGRVYLLGVFIYWACLFIGRVYLLGQVYLFCPLMQ